MARITHRLTAVTVENLKSKGLHPDGDGLYLRITENGTKSWMFRFSREGRSRDMGLGPICSIPLSKARQLAAEARRQRLDGVDPIKARKAKRGAARLAESSGMTFKACAERLMNAHESAWRNAKHRQQWRNTLKTYAYPLLGDLPVEGIDTALVMQVLEPIWTRKPETAGRVRGRIEAVLDWAKARGLRQAENAARWRGHLDHLLPNRSKVRRVRHHPALPYDELPAFMASVRQRSGVTPRALEFTILTAARTSEALGARWEEIDLKARMWVVPAERMKMDREHRVPLSPRAVALLGEMAETRQSEIVFPGLMHDRSLSNMALLMLVRQLRPGITVHGFRSSFRDWAAERTTTPSFVAEAALAHVVADRVEAAYRRGDLFEKRRKLMEAWAAYCERKPGVIVDLRRRGASS